jgi:hypothetical protein
VSNENADDSGFDLEQSINLIAQRMFPRWYARHAVKEIKLPTITDINPKSYFCHRWLSLINVHEAAAESLNSSHQQWHSLAELLKKLNSENEYPRLLSISAIHGINVSQCEEDFADLISYGAQQANQIPQDTDNDFNRNITLAFPQEKLPFHVCYREWDGRYYYLNEDEPRHLAALLMQCKKQQRDYNIACTIHVESINGRMLERLRSGFWMLLMKRKHAYQLYQLLKQANFECEIAEFEWRRSDLVFLIARKDDRALNDIVFNLISNHSSTQVVDWGRFLSQSRFPFHNK